VPALGSPGDVSDRPRQAIDAVAMYYARQRVGRLAAIYAVAVMLSTESLRAADRRSAGPVLWRGI
jgi:hypothetical protein